MFTALICDSDFIRGVSLEREGEVGMILAEIGWGELAWVTALEGRLYWG